MSDAGLERRRTVWDVVLGILLVVAGLVILGHAVTATAISVLLIGWVALFSGAFALVGAVFRIGKGGAWSTALSGGLLLVLGIVFLRNPAAAALTLTLVAGTLFLVGGVTRIVASFQQPEYRVPLLISGILSAILGLIVVFNVTAATLTLLGVLVGTEALIDGITLLLVGRVRPRTSSKSGVVF